MRTGHVNVIRDREGRKVKWVMAGCWVHCVLPWKNCTLREQDPKHTVTEYIVLSFSLTFIAIQIAELLKCMLSHTGDLGSRLDTLDDIDTEKTVHIPKLLHCS